MIIDNHVHVGWYSDGYHSPYEVWSTLERAGVSRAVVSSTSTCAELYSNIKTEFYQMFRIAGKSNISPILWISPRMLVKKWPLKDLLKSKIEWRGIKLHYLSHPQFSKSKKLVMNALEVARMLGNVPILLHTGELENCYPSVFLPIIRDNPDLKFVLAHGRPLSETISIMEFHINVWTDTAFMPIDSIYKLKKRGLTQRVLFGTDFPISKIYYPDISFKDYLNARVVKIQTIDPKILNNSIY